jgi:hypothetical protein
MVSWPTSAASARRMFTELIAISGLLTSTEESGLCRVRSTQPEATEVGNRVASEPATSDVKINLGCGLQVVLDVLA